LCLMDKPTSAQAHGMGRLLHTWWHAEGQEITSQPMGGDQMECRGLCWGWRLYQPLGQQVRCYDSQGQVQASLSSDRRLTASLHCSKGRVALVATHL
jgi:hypothetical protein